MNRRLGTLLALAAVLSQAAPPLFAAMAPAMSMPRPAAVANQHCSGATAEPGHPAVDRDRAMQPTAMHFGDSCCCQGPWNCGGPCGLLALGARSPLLALPDPARIWSLPTSARPATAHLQELLKPPTDS